jgi:radical SAM enzyme (TIGR01210 family)
MCDLWKTALPNPLPAGAIVEQVDAGLDELRKQLLESGGDQPRQIKLYNGGSFFDAGAIPPSDYTAIAARVRDFDRVVVECHPALVGRRTWEFRDLLGAGNLPPTLLEVAMGLETAHPSVLEKLNKRMTLEQFARAAHLLSQEGVALRVFVLVQPPFMPAAESLEWAGRSIDFAFQCGATVVSLIPTRDGNGAMETLARRGLYQPPSLATLESALAYGIQLRQGRVFADLWDTARFSRCASCAKRRIERLHQINLCQEVLPSINCEVCRSHERADTP